MPQIVKKRRSGWAILAVGALVASMFAVGASPAAAITDDSTQDSPSSTSACVGPALADAGFTDLGDLGAVVSDINCLAYYGITTGTTADTFDPSSNVTRGQMALFLYRTANVAGLDLMGGDMSVDFGDITELGEDRQNAINALARNGILAGRSNMAFEPHADINRAEMAVALVNLVAMVPGAPVDKEDNGTYTVGDPADDDVFADAFVSVSAPVNSAITAAYELGITTGYDDGTFRPSASVPRRNMASFITRALAHTNAAPAGLTAQNDNNVVVVSVRDANFAPVANAVIDAFHADSEAADKAFRADGTCALRTGTSTPTEDGTTKCTIDRLDPGTDSQGNADLSRVTPAEKGSIVWVWTGDTGDKVGASTDLYEVDLPPTAADTTGAVRRATVSRDLGAGLDARFGTTVTYTIQLEAGLMANGAAALQVSDAVKWVNAGPDDAGDAYELTITFPRGTSEDDLEIDADGKATFTLTAPNPTSKQDLDVELSFSLVQLQQGDDPATAVTNEGADSPGFNDEGDSDGTADGYQGLTNFSEARPRVNAIDVEAVNEYSPAAAPPDNPATGNAIIVTVTDQYGDPLGDVKVTAITNRSVDPDNDPLTAAVAGSTLTATPRYTRSNGKVRISYAYTGPAQSELISVEYDGDAEGAADTGCTNVDDEMDLDVCGSETVYWTKAATPGVVSGEMLTADVENDTIILENPEDDKAPTVVVYDGNDQFVDATGNVTLAAFEEKLTAGLAPGADPVTVAVDSYTGDADDVARFTLS